MKFIGQYRASIGGSHLSEIIDVILIEDNKIIVYKRKSNNSFELLIINKDDFNKFKFEELINYPEKLSSDCNLLETWRTSWVKNPIFLPLEYYLNIYDLNNTKDLRYLNKIRHYKEEVKNFLKATEEL